MPLRVEDWTIAAISILQRCPLARSSQACARGRIRSVKSFVLGVVIVSRTWSVLVLRRSGGPKKELKSNPRTREMAKCTCCDLLRSIYGIMAFLIAVAYFGVMAAGGTTIYAPNVKVNDGAFVLFT